MNEIELLIFGLCVMPLVTAGVAIFACELRIQYNENDTRRYPRYGQSEDMRVKDKFRVKSKFENNET